MTSIDKKKAYKCSETCSGEWTACIVFAKTNLEARKRAANELNDGELGGLQVIRAPELDKYGNAGEIPISVLVDAGWYFECMYSGITINSGVYEDGSYYYDQEKRIWDVDEFLIGKEPSGFYGGWQFACKEYEDLYREDAKQKKEFEAEQLELYQGIIQNRFPDASFDEDGYEYNHFYTEGHSGSFVLTSAVVSFQFPGAKYGSAQLRTEPRKGIGPFGYYYSCSGGDKETFEEWAKV